MNQEILQEIGLNKSESQVYLALLELGEAKTGQICNKLNIPNSHIYTDLDSLTKKGLVSYKYANRVKVFKASDPNSLKLLFERKRAEIKKQENQLSSLVDTLKKMPKNKETDTDYQYFEGIPGLKSMAREVYTNTPKNTQMELFSAQSEAWEKINAFYLEMHKIRKSRRIKMKMIMQKSTNKLKEKIKEREKIGLIDIRTLDFSNNAEFLITNNYLIIQDTSNQTKVPSGFMIKNKVFIALFKEIYGFLWDKAKKS